MHAKNVLTAGRNISQARKAAVLLHGRGAAAEDILSLRNYLKFDDFALLAPQAGGGSWYPCPFLAPPEQNEPWLTSALEVLRTLSDELAEQGIATEHQYFLGFSQGACLALEYTARNPERYGGVAAFTGGLIGDRIYPERYTGDFLATPIFIGTSDPDPHVPLQRVEDSARLLRQMNADVTMQVYPGAGHTIVREEIDFVNTALLSE